MTLFIKWNYSTWKKKRSRSLWLYILHPCQWFYIWLYCYTEYTVFLCGWWQWWGSRVEMGFSCPCLSLTLAEKWVKPPPGHSRSVCLPATRQDFHYPTRLRHISLETMTQHSKDAQWFPRVPILETVPSVTLKPCILSGGPCWDVNSCGWASRGWTLQLRRPFLLHHSQAFSTRLVPVLVQIRCQPVLCISIAEELALAQEDKHFIGQEQARDNLSWPWMKWNLTSDRFCGVKLDPSRGEFRRNAKLRERWSEEETACVLG